MLQFTGKLRLRASPNPFNHGLPGDNQSTLITYSSCISECTWLWAPKESPNLLDYSLWYISQLIWLIGLPLDNDTWLNTSATCDCTLCLSTSLDAFLITPKYHLQPDWLYVYNCSDTDRIFMPHDDVVNLVTIIKGNWINEILYGCQSIKTTAGRILRNNTHSGLIGYRSFPLTCVEISMAPKFHSLTNHNL